MAEVLRGVISKQNMRLIHSEEGLAAAQSLGGVDPVIRRASNVDPTGDLSPTAFLWLAHRNIETLSPADWWGDMLPVNGPVLGPFKTRQEALDAETTWLKAHGIPLAGEHTRKAEIDVNRDPGTQHD